MAARQCASGGRLHRHRDSYLCAQLGAGFATDLSTASRHTVARLGRPEWDPELCRIFGVRAECLPALRDSVGELGTLRHGRWRTDLPTPCPGRRPAGRVGRGRLRGPGPRQGDLRHLACSCSASWEQACRAKAAAAGVPTDRRWSVDGQPSYALDGGVFSAGALIDWLVDGLGLYDSPEELRSLPRLCRMLAV